MTSLQLNRQEVGASPVHDWDGDGTGSECCNERDDQRGLFPFCLPGGCGRLVLGCR